MLEGRLMGIDKVELRFISEDNEHFKIIPDKDSNLYYQHEMVEKDIISGYLLNNRYFKMFGCIYNRKYFSCQGYVYSKYNNPPDILSQFHRITFAGKPVDVFSGGSINVMAPYQDNISWEERAFIMEPRYWKDINTHYTVTIEGMNCEVGIDYSIEYNNEWSERNIGVCIPRLYIDFKEAVSIELIPKCYLWAFDFMKFLSFRRNIKFDRINIFKWNDERKTVKTGVVYFRTINRGEYTNTELNTITAEDIGDKFGEVFQYIAERRKGNTSDELLIPNNDKEFKEITHTSFLECALSFEGEYDRTQETKTATNEKFQDVKQLAINITINETCKMVEEADGIKAELLEFIKNGFTSEIEKMTEQMSNNQTKKVVNYAKNILDMLDKIDYSLEEQFNNLLNKKYSDILKYYKESLAKKLGINLNENKNLGRIFANMRNNIGHGHPKRLEAVHVYTFCLARCMIYIMILDNVGISHNNIRSIVQKIFK